MADLRLASYNIKSAQHLPNGLDALAATLRAIDPDIVALQEVDRLTERSNRTDQTAELAERLGFEHHTFAAATAWPGGGEYGVALISRHPLEDVVATPLWVPTDPSVHESFREPRTLVSATVRVADVAIRVFGTHLGLEAKQRTVQVREIAAAFDQASVIRPAVVLGDLNCPPDAHEVEPLMLRLHDAHQQLPFEERGTFPTDGHASEKAVTDYILVRSDLAVSEAYVFHREREPAASDHYVLLAAVSVA
jgi:endonuclease/exonuclease/phosphatase family metal-dependent hydrolase